MLQCVMLIAALPVFALPACAASAGLQQALAYAKAHQQTFNDQLMDLIAIPSISALPGGICACIAKFATHWLSSAQLLLSRWQRPALHVQHDRLLQCWQITGTTYSEQQNGCRSAQPPSA
jgi:hypothetical protein